MKEVLKNMETESLKSSTVEIIAPGMVVLKVRALGREGYYQRIGTLSQGTAKNSPSLYLPCKHT